MRMTSQFWMEFTMLEAVMCGPLLIVCAGIVAHWVGERWQDWGL